MSRMWAYVYNSNGQISKERVPVPAIRPNDVLVKIDKVSVCGSDFHIFSNDDWAKESVDPGIVIGHEGCGEIISTGTDISNYKPGDYVALESHFACPSCESEGKTADECNHYGIIGIHGSRSGFNDHQVGGVFAEYIAIPSYCCHPVSDKIRNSVPLSLLEPAGNSWEIVRYLRAKGLPESIAVFGCGPHGLNLQLFAKYAGVKTVVAFEVDPWRRDFAKEFGAADFIADSFHITDGEIFEISGKSGFDVAIDMVGNAKVVDRCKNIVRDDGEIILFGLPRHESLIAHGENFAEIIFNNEIMKIKEDGKKINLRGFTGRTEPTWKELITALDESQYLREMISKPIKNMGSLSELEKFINDRQGPYLKVGFSSF